MFKNQIENQSKINNLLILGSICIFLLNAIQAFFTPLIDDEAYYWVWSQRLSWGYFDHPPMVAWWIKPGFALLQNELGVRLMTILAAALGYGIFGHFLRLKNRSEFWLYSLMYLSFVMFQVFSFITTPDAPLLFFSIIYLVIWRRFLDKQNWVNTVLLGVIMALLMYSKYHAALLILFSIFPVFWQLRLSRYIYFAIMFGILLYLPHLWWQWNHDFVSLEFHLVRRSVHDHFKFNFITDYLLAILYTGSPLLFYFVAKRLLKMHWKNWFEKSMYWTVVTSIIFLFLLTFKTYVQAQWILVALVPMFYLLFEYLRENLRYISIAKKLAIAGAFLLMAGRVYMMIPDPPIKIQYHGYKSFMQAAGEKTDHLAAFEKYQYTSLFNFYNFPDKLARNIVTNENRKSQYDIWQSEEDLQGKDFTYFSPYIHSTDSVILHSAKKEVFKAKRIERFDTFYLIDIDIIAAKSTKSSLTLDLLLNNGHERTVRYTPEGNMKLYANFTPEKFALESYCMEMGELPAFTLNPGQSIRLQAIIPRCDLSSGQHFMFLGFAREDIPMKIQSNHLEITYPFVESDKTSPAIH